MCTPNSTGIVYDWVEIGCTMYMGIVIVINLKLAMKTRWGGRHWGGNEGGERRGQAGREGTGGGMRGGGAPGAAAWLGGREGTQGPGNPYLIHAY